MHCCWSGDTQRHFFYAPVGAAKISPHKIFTRFLVCSCGWFCSEKIINNQQRGTN